MESKLHGQFPMDLADAEIEPKKKGLKHFFVSKAEQPANVSGSKKCFLVRNAGAALNSFLHLSTLRT